jgi:sugar (pentulose or hexulose) kinase
MVFCGIDIGTTNTKAVVINSEGKVLDTASIAVGPDGSNTASPVWYEHCRFILGYFAFKGLFAGTKTICSITAQGGSFVLLDEKLRPVSRAYSWTENADYRMVEGLKESLGLRRYYHITGWNPSSWLIACKLKELISERNISEKIRHVATVPDFIFSQIVGKPVTDITNAQITGLCDFKSSQWCDEILDWAGLKSEFLPPIIDKLSILFDDVKTEWGRISFTTSSHDQYAAMQAACLEKDREVMLGTGTAWVINARSVGPSFDDRFFISHPGRDLFQGCFGNIITLGIVAKPIGRGLDDLLERYDISKKQLARVEKDFCKRPAPEEAVTLDSFNIETADQYDDADAVKRYMEAAASLAAFMLERFQDREKNERIIMSGGAASSHFWPQVVADVCDTVVKTVIFPEFAAYGAALHAKSAYEGKEAASDPAEFTESRMYEPVNNNKYRSWYEQYQRPMFEELIEAKTR